MAAKDTPKEVQEFEAELRTIYDSKPHISASKISNLTKLAIKGVKHYKHIVHVVEKFIQKCPPEYKLSGLYVVDAICRASKSASLKDPKYYRTGGEPYGPRFAGVLPGLTGQIVTATEKDKERISRLIGVWREKNIFEPSFLDTAEKKWVGIPATVASMQANEPNPPINTQNILATLASFTQTAPVTSNIVAPSVKSALPDLSILNIPGATAMLPKDIVEEMYKKQAANVSSTDSSNKPESSALSQSSTATADLTSSLGLSTNSAAPNLMHLALFNQLLQQPATTPPLGSPLLSNLQTQSQAPNILSLLNNIQSITSQTSKLDDESSNGTNRSDSQSSTPPHSRKRKMEDQNDDDNQRDKSRRIPRYTTTNDSAENKLKLRNWAQIISTPVDRDTGEWIFEEGNVDSDKLHVYSRTLYIGGITPSVTKAMLQELFEPMGEVESILINYPKHNAFLKMRSRKLCELVKQTMAGTPVADTQIRINWACGFGPKDLFDFSTGSSLIPLARLQDGDKRWLMTGKFGGIRKGLFRGGLTIEEPEVYIPPNSDIMTGEATDASSSFYSKYKQKSSYGAGRGNARYGVTTNAGVRETSTNGIPTFESYEEARPSVRGRGVGRGGRGRGAGGGGYRGGAHGAGRIPTFESNNPPVTGGPPSTQHVSASSMYQGYGEEAAYGYYGQGSENWSADAYAAYGYGAAGWYGSGYTDATAGDAYGWTGSVQAEGGQSNGNGENAKSEQNGNGDTTQS